MRTEPARATGLRSLPNCRDAELQAPREQQDGAPWGVPTLCPEVGRARPTVPRSPADAPAGAHTPQREREPRPRWGAGSGNGGGTPSLPGAPAPWHPRPAWTCSITEQRPQVAGWRTPLNYSPERFPPVRRPRFLLPRPFKPGVRPPKDTPRPLPTTQVSAGTGRQPHP